MMATSKIRKDYQSDIDSLNSNMPYHVYDFQVAISSGSNYKSVTTGLPASKIRSIEIMYNDDFYYNPCVVALSPDTGNLNVKLFSNATDNRTYVVRIYHTD